MLIVTSLLLLGVLGLLGWSLAAAVRSRHLLLLYWRDAGLFVFERGEGREYVRLAVWQLPLAAARFAAAALRGRPRPVSTPLPALLLQPQRARLTPH